MKTIEERAYKYAEAATWDDVDGCPSDIYATNAYNAYVEGATEQKAIDDAELLKLKSAWEKEAKINSEANYKQGYHDAVEKACDWLEKELKKIAIDEIKDDFLENNFILILKSQVPVWLTNFRKSMEE